MGGRRLDGTALRSGFLGQTTDHAGFLLWKSAATASPATLGSGAGVMPLGPPTRPRDAGFPTGAGRARAQGTSQTGCAPAAPCLMESRTDHTKRPLPARQRPVALPRAPLGSTWFCLALCAEERGTSALTVQKQSTHTGRAGPSPEPAVCGRRHRSLCSTQDHCCLCN